MHISLCSCHNFVMIELYTVKNVLAIFTKYGGNSHNPNIHHGGKYISGYYHHFIEDIFTIKLSTTVANSEVGITTYLL